MSIDPNPDSDRRTPVLLHHQAPAGRPGLGVGGHRHDGRGSRADGDPGGAASARRPVQPRRDHLTAAQIGGTVTGDARRDRLRHRCLQPDHASPTLTSTAPATTASSSTADHVNTTSSQVHEIGDNPFDGMQRGRAILYINGATGTISGNKVYDFQKNGIEVSGLNADASGRSDVKTSVTVLNNVVTGEGHHRLHRPERHRGQGRRERHREGQHRQRPLVHAGRHRGYRPAELQRRQDHRVGQQVRRHRGAHRRPGDRERPRATPRPGPPARRPHRPQQRGAAGRSGTARQQARLEDQGRRHASLTSSRASAPTTCSAKTSRPAPAATWSRSSRTTSWCARPSSAPDAQPPQAAQRPGPKGPGRFRIPGGSEGGTSLGTVTKVIDPTVPPSGTGC